MAIAVLFVAKSMTATRYDEVMRRLDAAGAMPPPGLVHHTCFGSGEKMSVLDVWESPQAFEAFGRVLLPILQDLKIEAEPVVTPVHNMV